jgi:membrane associated rhomboid family serine protease
MLGAAIASSMTFLALQNISGAGGAVGLSGVTLALTAVFARIYPHTKLGMRIAGVIPVQMKAENFLLCMTAWSLVGSLSRMRSNIGHAAHLGGLLFGMAYHQLFL